MDRLAESSGQGDKVVGSHLDNYYSAICHPENVDTLDRYCDVFRKQMATWLIVPTLMAEKMNADWQFTNELKRAYGSFGIAWRLLDDIRDVEDDRLRAAPSAIYACLPQEIKDLWHHPPDEKRDVGCQTTAPILDCILENRIIDRLKKRIYNELASAAAIAESGNMVGLASELVSLGIPMAPEKRDPA